MPDPLLDVAALAGLLDSPDPPAVFDIRWSLGGSSRRADFEQAHIPGAVFLDLDTRLAGPPGAGGRHPLPSASDLQDALRAAGLDDGRAVVVYDEGDLMGAARGWWVLRWAGIPDVRVLAGGWAGWLARDGRAEAGPAHPDAGTVTVRTGGLPTVDADGAGRAACEGRLLDARTPERFRGEVEPVDPVAGHIPGARSLPAGRWPRSPDPALDRQRVQAVVEQEGLSDGVVAYCGSGVTAAQTVLMLQRVGVAAALYPGSWSEWSAAGRPVATGD